MPPFISQTGPPVHRHRTERLDLSPQDALAGMPRSPEQALKDYERMVYVVVKLFPSKRYPPGWGFDDVLQAGRIGILKAMEKYDPTRNTTFPGFCRRWIWWSINNEMRNELGIPGGARDQIGRMGHVQADFLEAFSRMPTKEELAEAIGVDVDRIEDIKRAHSLLSARSLDMPRGDEEDSSLYNLIEDGRALDRLDTAALAGVGRSAQLILDNAMAEVLDSRETEIVWARFSSGETYAEIGERYELCRERIRQIIVGPYGRSGALGKLKAHLVRQGFDPEELLEAGMLATAKLDLGDQQASGSLPVIDISEHEARMNLLEQRQEEARVAIAAAERIIATDPTVVQRELSEAIGASSECSWPEGTVRKYLPWLLTRMGVVPSQGLGVGRIYWKTYTRFCEQIGVEPLDRDSTRWTVLDMEIPEDTVKLDPREQAKQRRKRIRDLENQKKAAGGATVVEEAPPDGPGADVVEPPASAPEVPVPEAPAPKAPAPEAPAALFLPPVAQAPGAPTPEALAPETPAPEVSVPEPALSSLTTHGDKLVHIMALVAQLHELCADLKVSVVITPESCEMAWPRPADSGPSEIDG